MELRDGFHGGDRCHAREGEHREHAVFANDYCASAHPSDVAAALLALGARVRIAAPSTLLPARPERLGAEVFTDMWKALDGADVVMMLRLQRERMEGSYVPSTREYFHFFGLDQEKLARAKPDAVVMHPGPMNRGVEIASTVADHSRSVIRDQVEMGVAVRMAVLEALARNLPKR